MTISMQTSSANWPVRHFKFPALNRRSPKWPRRRRRSEQSKSIRSRQWPAASGSNLNERQHGKWRPPLAEVELHRGVSINHDAEGHLQWHRAAAAAAAVQKPLPIATTSGMGTKSAATKSATTSSSSSGGGKHHPQMISQKESKSSSCAGQQQKHLGLAASASGTYSHKSVSVGLVMLAVALMVLASDFYNANLVGHCNCDTLSGHNPFSGGRAPARGRSVVAASQQVESKLASIERQHFGAGHSRPASSGTFKLDRASDNNSNSNSNNNNNNNNKASRAHEDYLKDILASHESRDSGSKLSSRRPEAFHQMAGSSKAEHGLRQIMMMHEQAARPPASSMSKASSIKTSQPASLKRPQAKILSMLPGDLLTSSSSRIISMLPSGLTRGKTNSSSQMELAAAPSVMNSPFSQRASAKNYLMGSLLGMGKMLINQPNSPDKQQQQQQQRRRKNQQQQQQPIKTSPMAKTKNPKSSPVDQRLKAASKPASELLINAIVSSQQRSTTPATPSDESNQSLSGASDERDQTKSKLGETKKSSLMDGATDLAQAYLKDSLRDLLTLTQLPIFSGGPVSTAPSELEPGGKKWLANKQASEQIRGNRTHAIEDLLRYIYILGNVGVRRKRDPLRALSSNPRPLNALSTASQPAAKRPLLTLLDVAGMPGISSIMKFRPPNKLSGSKLGSLLGPAGDQIKSRGVMWEMATDPTLAVTMMHLLERASVALPLGFLLMPFVRMTRHPLGGISLDRIIPARASHRSVDLEELAKRLDMVDKILSRSMRPTHRDASPFIG